MDFGLVLQTDPPGLGASSSLMRRAERNGFTLRLDLRLRRALAGAVRHLQPILDTHREADRRPDGHQPGHPHLGGHRLHLRHPQRHVRQPHGVRHRPRRLRDARRRPQAQHPRPARRGHRGHPRPRPRAARPTSTAQPMQLPVGQGRAELPVWMAAYGPKALALTGREGRRLHPPARRPLPHRVDGQGGHGRGGRRRARPGRRHHLRRRARVRHRGRLARGARPRPRAVPLVRRHGRQPRRRPGLPLRRALRPGPRGTHRVHQGPRRATTTATTAAPATPTPPSCPTRSSTASA